MNAQVELNVCTSCGSWIMLQIVLKTNILHKTPYLKNYRFYLRRFWSMHFLTLMFKTVRILNWIFVKLLKCSFKIYIKTCFHVLNYISYLVLNSDTWNYFSDLRVDFITNWKIVKIVFTATRLKIPLRIRSNIVNKSIKVFYRAMKSVIFFSRTAIQVRPHLNTSSKHEFRSAPQSKNAVSVF